MFKEIIQNEMGFWSTLGPYSDIVLSSRIRLARNIRGLPFSSKLLSQELEKIRALLEKFQKESAFNSGMILIDLSRITSNEKRYLRERNIITYEMEISDLSLVLVSEKDNFIIMVNDEDHIRIQVIMPGLQLLTAYRIADRADSELNRFADYSFSDKFGFLTSCPSNLGTGLKVSAMLHLPVLSMQNRVSHLTNKIKKIGVNLTGTIGDGVKTIGGIYQVYNRVTLGLSEVDIIELVDGVVNKMIELEDNARDKYMSGSRVELEDKAWRSYGILEYSRRISYTEAIEHLSMVRLGIILAIIKKIDIKDINDLMVNIQWAHLQLNTTTLLDNMDSCDEHRASFIKSYIKKMER